MIEPTAHRACGRRWQAGGPGCQRRRTPRTLISPSPSPLRSTTPTTTASSPRPSSSACAPRAPRWTWRPRRWRPRLTSWTQVPEGQALASQRVCGVPSPVLCGPCTAPASRLTPRSPNAPCRQERHAGFRRVVRLVCAEAARLQLAARQQPARRGGQPAARGRQQLTSAEPTFGCPLPLPLLSFFTCCLSFCLLPLHTRTHTFL